MVRPADPWPPVKARNSELIIPNPLRERSSDAPSRPASYRTAAPRERRGYFAPTLTHLGRHGRANRGVHFEMVTALNGARFRVPTDKQCAVMSEMSLTAETSGYADAVRLLRPTWWQALGRWVGR